MSYRADKQVLTAHTDGRTDGHTDRQTQATTIPEGQNWPQVKIVHHINTIWSLFILFFCKNKFHLLHLISLTWPVTSEIHHNKADRYLLKKNWHFCLLHDVWNSITQHLIYKCYQNVPIFTHSSLSQDYSNIVNGDYKEWFLQKGSAREFPLNIIPHTASLNIDQSWFI